MVCEVDVTAITYEVIIDFSICTMTEGKIMLD